MRAPRCLRSWKSSFPTAHLSFNESWQAYNITMIQKLLTVPRYVVRHENELFDEAGEEVEVPHQPQAISYSALPLYCDGRWCSVLDHHHYYASRSAVAISANTIKLCHLRPSAFTTPSLNTICGCQYAQAKNPFTLSTGDNGDNQPPFAICHPQCCQ